MSSIYSCDIPPRVWGREARHQAEKKIYLQCFLKNTPKCVSILWFSQLQIHSNFFTSFKLLKFGHEVNIISINSFLSGSYLEHLKRKCISSSTSPELHCWQSLWCRGIPWYLPNSICKWWEETLNLHILLLSSKFLINFKYFSQPKLVFTFVYVWSFPSEQLFIFSFHRAKKCFRRLLTTYFFDNFFLDFSLCSKTQELFGILSEVS